MSTHRHCSFNCGGTACPATTRITFTPPCQHLNGWWVNVKFLIFTRRVFVCSDCGEHVKGKQPAGEGEK